MILTIPGRPWRSKNEERDLHWGDILRYQSLWAKLAWVAWVEAGRPGFDRCTVTVRLFFPCNARRDRDNYSGAGLKGLLDGLKGRAYPDDADGVIDLRPVEFHVDKARPRVEIELAENHARIAQDGLGVPYVP